MTRLVGVVTVFALAATASAGFAGELRIVQKPIPGGFRVAIIDFVGGDQNVAQAMIGPTVAAICGPMMPKWGKFTLKAQITAAMGKPLKPGSFEQEIQCVAPPPPESVAPTPPFSATDSDAKAAEDAAVKFLQLRSSGNATGSYAMLTPTMQTDNTREDWKRQIDPIPAVVGKNLAIKIVKLTWYVDPPGVSPGVYVAADFDGNSDGMAIYCGFVAFKRQPMGEFRVVRIEEGRLRAEDARKATPEKMIEIRGQLQCRN